MVRDEHEEEERDIGLLKSLLFDSVSILRRVSKEKRVPNDRKTTGYRSQNF